LEAGHRIDIGDVAIEVLHPPRPDWERQKVRNDDSLVLRLHYRDIELLLTGDIGTAVEDELQISRERPLRLLKIAHHGSRTSTGAAFVRRYDPLVGLISAGAGNVFGHPAAAVLDRLDGQDAHVFRTDRSGAVIVETDGDEIRVRTWAGQTWQAAFWRSSS
jgi:competence protein ComEC